MRFMLMLYADEKAGVQIPPERMNKVMEGMAAYQAALTKAGAFVMTSPLALTRDARTIRMEGATVGFKGDSFVAEGGELKVVDGPYAETREQFGGFYIIDVPDMPTALDWATKCPAAQWGSIEIRPMVAGYKA